MAQDGTTEEGNTKPPRKCRKWCFTLNNWTEEEYSSLKRTISTKQWNYIIGKECGTNGTKHLQGYLECKNAISFESIKKYLPRAHIEKAKGNKEQNCTYCSKEEDFETNISFHHPKPIKDPLQGKELYDFQKEILELIKQEPDDRKIYWYWDSKGCTGKTTLAKHVCMNYNALYVQGKATDIKHGVIEMIKKRGEIDIVIMGLPRSSEGYVSYDAIESVKDGLFYSGKYESGMCVFNSPHMIIFSNFHPDEFKLSQDRWVIKCLDEFEIIDEPSRTIP